MRLSLLFVRKSFVCKSVACSRDSHARSDHTWQSVTPCAFRRTAQTSLDWCGALQRGGGCAADCLDLRHDRHRPCASHQKRTDIERHRTKELQNRCASGSTAAVSC